MKESVFTVSITCRHGESRRGQLGPLGWRRAGLQDIIGHIFDEFFKKEKKKNSKSTKKGVKCISLIASPLLAPCEQCSNRFPHRSGGDGGTVGDKTAMFQLSLRYVPPRSILCRYQPPLSLSGDFVSSQIWTGGGGGGGGGGKVESAEKASVRPSGNLM